MLGYIWQFVFSRVFVGIGDATGWSLFESSWLSDPSLAFAALVLVSVWQLSGYMILIYVAGFMGLNQDVMEAASIDGATEMAAMHVYEKAFTSRQFGVGQAEALILFVIVAIISGVQVYMTKRQEVEA